MYLEVYFNVNDGVSKICLEMKIYFVSVIIFGVLDVLVG